MSSDHKNILLSTCYLAPINYYSLLIQKREAIVEQYEHFRKQTYRNRANIYGPNGLHPIIIPVRYKNHTPIKDVLIAYDYDWQLLHWKTLESAYRKSPYFEFYESDLLPFYEKRFEFLLEFNQAIQEKIVELLGVKINFQLTSSYVANIEIMKFTQTIMEKTLDLFGAKTNVQLPSSYVANSDGLDDFREAFHPKVVFNSLSKGREPVSNLFREAGGGGPTSKSLEINLVFFPT